MGERRCRSSAEALANESPRKRAAHSRTRTPALLKGLVFGPTGTFLHSQELAGLFLNMSRYSGGQDNEFWLEAWNGSAYTVERMGRPPIAVDHLLIGVIGGLQPDKLARSFKGDLDGMYARVLFSWPADPPYRPLTNEVAEIEPEIINALSRLVDLPCGEKENFAWRAVPLSTQSVEVFELFRQDQHRYKEGLDGREREWWARTPANVLRLAGTLSYLSWAMGGGGSEPEQIEVEFVEAATRLVRDYFWPHSRAALRQIGLNERYADARRVLRWIRIHQKDEVSLKDVRREALNQNLDADQTQALLAVLVKAGWLNESNRSTGGRPMRRWKVNPKLSFDPEGAGSAGSAGRI